MTASLFMSLQLLCTISVLRHSADNAPRCPRSAAAAWRYLLAVFFFMLAVLSKSMAVTLPVLLVVHQRLLARRCFRPLLWETSPFWIIALATATVTVLSQSLQDTIRGYVRDPRRLLGQARRAPEPVE